MENGGGGSSLHYCIIKLTMIDKNLLVSTIEKALEGTDMFLVDATVGNDNRIVVEIDSDTAVDIDSCASLSRTVEATFNRDIEDYELEIGSAGLTSPMRVPRQYVKNIGNKVEVLTRDGRKLKGTLDSADDKGFTIKITKKVKPEGAKRPIMAEEPLTFGYDEIKHTIYLIEF